VKAALRWFGVALFGVSFLGCLVLAPLTAGFTMLLGAPSLAVALWLVLTDLDDLPEATTGAKVALAIGGLVLVWVFTTLLRDTDIYGRPLG
jgi:hypothetical protein